MEKRDLRTLTPEARAELRRVAVRRYRAGLSKSAIAREIGLRRATVSDWLIGYEQTGSAIYQESQRGKPKGSGRTLTAEQEASIQRDIVDHTPDQLKLPFALWGRELYRN